ncbi:MAG TPA: FHA domain-containing protein [Kofleriaceae bacterium]
MIAWDVELELDGELQTYQTRRVDDEHYQLSFGSSRLADVVIEGVAATECWLIVNDVGFTWLRDARNETRRLAVNEPFVLGDTRIRLARSPTVSAGTWRVKFRVAARGGFAREAVFHKAEVIVGRDPKVDLVLDSGNASRKHTRFTVDEAGAVWVHDLGSTNGMWVNGMRAIHQKFEVGHRLMIGEYVIELVEPAKRVPK